MSDQQQRLAQAIACYQQWKNCLERLSDSLVEDYTAETWSELAVPLQAARQADQALLACLPSTSLENSAEFSQYRLLVASVAEQVRDLQQRAQTLKALTSAELSELRGNKVAVAGYRPSQTDAKSAFSARG